MTKIFNSKITNSVEDTKEGKRLISENLRGTANDDELVEAKLALLAGMLVDKASKCQDNGTARLLSAGDTFPYGALLALLMAESDTFCRAVLGEFAHRCPLTVPYFPSGSKTDPDVAACHVRLLACLLQTTVPPEGHLLGLDEAWSFLARLYTLPLVGELNYHALAQMLKVAGFRLHQRFGDQFEKLLRAFKRRYDPKDENNDPHVKVLREILKDKEYPPRMHPPCDDWINCGL